MFPFLETKQANICLNGSCHEPYVLSKLCTLYLLVLSLSTYTIRSPTRFVVFVAPRPVSDQLSLLNIRPQSFYVHRKVQE